MVFFLTLETTAWLFNLVFNIAFFPEQCYFLCIWVAVLYSRVIMVAIANTFPNIARLPYCLNIPSNSFQLKLVRQGLTRKMDSNLSVLQWAMLLVLCLCLQHLKIRQYHSLTLLFSLFYSTFTLAFEVLTILILKYNMMKQATHQHIRSGFHELTLISKNGQAPLPCSMERNLP